MYEKKIVLFCLGFHCRLFNSGECEFVFVFIYEKIVINFAVFILLLQVNCYVKMCIGILCIKCSFD